MGASQSKGTGTGSNGTSGPLDYYQVLEIEVEATQEEIKKAYRK